MKNKIPLYQVLLITLQFGGIFYFAMTGSVVPESVLPSILIIVSVINGLWAVLTMNKDTLTVMPELRKNASLVTTGPYRFVRHPMYTSVTLLLTGMLIDNFDWMRLLVLIMVLIVLILKINIEEKQLRMRFPAYESYQLKTKRFIPFIF
jgi:protein-S-isoprenylcysteine O-methyltransferase Ste14